MSGFLRLPACNTKREQSGIDTGCHQKQDTLMTLLVLSSMLTHTVESVNYLLPYKLKSCQNCSLLIVFIIQNSPERSM